jgi:2-polyprenyl-3-methyl-5-hydroxy-6-metoxy-1,4-benzoquinol methylase
MPLIAGLLSHVSAHISFQCLVGADRLRYRSIGQLALSPGDTVFDAGCGPAYCIERLPSQMKYYEYDTEPRYVNWAQRRWAHGDATFRLGVFDAEQSANLPQVDAVLLLGILPHLSDEESTNLLALAARSLAPSGGVVAADTCFVPSQGRVSRSMASYSLERLASPEAIG